jgi:phosphoglucosamine mutase
LANRDLTAELAVDLSVAAAHVLGETGVFAGHRPTAVVGRDSRASGEFLEAAVVAGLASAGVDVLQVGVLPTPAVAFLTADYDADFGVMISASHNPMPDNGIKFFAKGGHKLDDSLEDTIEARLREDWQRPIGADVGRLRDTPDGADRYVAHIVAAAPHGLEGLRVVVDCANGAASEVGPEALRALGADVVAVFCEPDGVNINDGCGSTHMDQLRDLVREHRADAGVAFDGDADRCFFVDDTGEFVPGDFVTALLAESILEKEGPAKIIYDVRASWVVPHTVERAGGVPLVNRVGHAYVKHRMRKEGAVFGGEVSGHYYFRDFTQADSGVVPFLLMLELISKRGQKLSELLAPYRERYFLTGELNTPVADVPLKLRELEERFGPEGQISHLDGLSVEAADWHFNVRPSNTEPLLRLNLEGLSQQRMEDKRDEVLSVIRA